MKIRSFIIVLLILFFLLPSIVFAAGKVIFSQQFLVDQKYLASENQWQTFDNDDAGLYITGDGLMIKSDGDAYLIYPIEFDYRQYDKLKITLYSNKSVKVSITPLRNDKKFLSFELSQDLTANTNYQELNFSLRQKFFREEIEYLGINFYSTGKNPAEIVIKEISLEKMNFSQVLGQGFLDFWKVAPYSPFTVNLFPTPLILGWTALVYFLPIIFVLIGLFLYYSPWRKISLLILLAFWVFIDFRMMYEFLNHNFSDYKSFVKPPVGEKILRNYDDIYQFGDWLTNNVPEDTKEVKFYNFGSVHFPKILNYLIYPLKVRTEKEDSETSIHVIYNRTDIFYDEIRQKLYQNQSAITGIGEIVAQYNYYSFIFQEK